MNAASDSNCDPIVSSTRLYTLCMLKTFWQKKKSTNLAGTGREASVFPVQTRQRCRATRERLRGAHTSRTAPGGSGSSSTERPLPRRAQNRGCMPGKELAASLKRLHSPNTKLVDGGCTVPRSNQKFELGWKTLKPHLQRSPSRSQHVSEMIFHSSLRNAQRTSLEQRSWAEVFENVHKDRRKYCRSACYGQSLFQ